METQLKKSWTTVQRCAGRGEGYKGCGKLLVLSAKDIFICTFDNSPQEKKVSFYTFRCPNCGVFTHIPQWQIPKIVRKSICEKYSSLKPCNEAV